MPHEDPPDLTPERARAVAEAFGIGAPSTDPAIVASGEQGRVWLLTTTSGRWAVKEIDGAAPHARIADLLAFEDAAGGRLLMPRSRLRTDGSAVLDGADVGAIGIAYRVMTWVDLDFKRATTAADLAHAAAAVHLVDCPARGTVEPWFAGGVDDAAWAALLSRGRAAGADWVDSLERRLPALAALRTIATETDRGSLRTSHRDLNVGNARYDVAGEIVVLDWDLCGATDPRRELALLLAQLALQGEDAAVVAYRAYLDAGGPARVDTLTDFSSVSIACDSLAQHYADLSMSAHAARAALARERLTWILDAIDVATPRWLDNLLARLAAVRA